MEAPKEIYLVPFGEPISEPFPSEYNHDTIWSRTPYDNTNAGNIKYIRADLAELTAKDVYNIVELFKDMRDDGDWFQYSAPEEELLKRFNKQKRQ